MNADWDITQIERNGVPLDLESLRAALPTPCAVQAILGVEPLTTANAAPTSSDQSARDYASVIARSLRDETISRFGTSHPQLFPDTSLLRRTVIGGSEMKRLEQLAIVVQTSVRQNPPRLIGIDAQRLVCELLKHLYLNLGTPVAQIPASYSPRSVITEIAGILDAYVSMARNAAAELTVNPTVVGEYNPFIGLAREFDVRNEPDYAKPHIAIRGPFTGVESHELRRMVDVEIHAAIQEEMSGTRMEYSPCVSTGRTISRHARESGLLGVDESVSNIHTFTGIVLPVTRTCDAFVYHDVVPREPTVDGFSKAQLELRVASDTETTAGATTRPILDIRVGTDETFFMRELNGYTAVQLPKVWTLDQIARVSKLWVQHAMPSILFEAWSRRLRTFHEFPQFLRDREALIELIDLDEQLGHWSELPVTLPDLMRVMRPDIHRG